MPGEEALVDDAGALTCACRLLQRPQALAGGKAVRLIQCGLKHTRGLAEGHRDGLRVGGRPIDPGLGPVVGDNDQGEELLRLALDVKALHRLTRRITSSGPDRVGDLKSHACFIRPHDDLVGREALHETP